MRKIKNMKVMQAQCATCPFRGESDVRAMVEQRCLTQASQICHAPRLHGKRETHLCRGARNFQLTIFYRMGFLNAPTDACWDAKRQELGV
jgi:hypothetical protein